MAVQALPANLTDRLRQVRDLLLNGLVERDVAMRLALLAALAGEHLLLVGPPGTAKSLLARRLRLAFRETNYFERLLTRFTVPEELFGPLSIRGLEQDRYERLTDKYLPWASVAFLDEIFKANSAILNALLTLLNEREFDNGTRREKTRLLAVIGASNELPGKERGEGQGKELDALFDRFLLRLHVGYVSGEGFSQLLGLTGEPAPDVPDAMRFTTEDLQAIQAAAEHVSVPADVVAMLRALRDFCVAEKIHVSDRRWRKVKKLLQVSAVANGRGAVSIWDAWLLQHCLWDTADQREKIYQWYAERVGASAAMDTTELTRVVVAWEAKLKRDQEGKSQKRDDQGQLLYQGDDGLTTQSNGYRQATRRGKPLYLAPEKAMGVNDRSNDGNGYTFKDLENLSIDNNTYRGTQFSEWDGRKKYINNRDNWLMENVDLPPALEPTRLSPQYIRDCLQQLDAVSDGVERYMESIESHIGSMENDIGTHLWVTPDFIGPARSVLELTMNSVNDISARVDQVRGGFEKLPTDGA